MRMTAVRTKVATSALTPATPTLARIAVSAANSADISAQICHEAMAQPPLHPKLPRSLTHLTACAVIVAVAIDLGVPAYYFRCELGEPRQGAERPAGALRKARHGDPPNLIQLMLA